MTRSEPSTQYTVRSTQRENMARGTAPIEAASVVLALGPGAREVFVVRRSEQLKFFGGYHAFPGGKVNPGDAAVAVQSKNGPDADALRVAAVRELFEETGVLLARRADGRYRLGDLALADARRDLLAGSLDFAAFLSTHALQLQADDLVAAGSLLTPPFSPIRFNTQFYVAVLPAGQQAEVWPGELDAGAWTTPEALLAGWNRGECLVSPPTVSLLETLLGRAIEELPTVVEPLIQLRANGAIPPIYFAPGVQMIPLRTIGLPPTTYTNAYLIGTRRLYLFDPGAHEADEQQRLFDLLEARLTGGSQLAAVVLTHHHPDHIGAVTAVAERYRVPVLAHPRTVELLNDQVKIDKLLGEGERIELGTAPDGFEPWQLQALHTPGHAGGHLAFHEPHYRLMIAGDLVSMLSSVVIAPPDGDLTEYLASLRRVREYDCRMLFPGHGSPSVRPRQTLDDCLAHRGRREAELMAALAASQGQTAAELTRRLYAELPEQMLLLAGWQIDAGLEKLRREGRATASSDGYWTAS